MKRIIYLILLISFAGNAQISTTNEGFVKVKRKPIETSMVDSDSLNISKDDGIIRGIALSDFKGLLSITSGSTLIKVTPAEYLALSQTELDNNDYLIVDVKSAGSNDFMLKSEYDANDDGTIDDVERLGGQLPSFYLDNTERTDEEIEDIIGAKVVAGSNITVDYDDSTGETTINSTASGGSTDHGALTGLEGDDHIQYFNQARGDARYLQTEVDGSVTNELQTISKSGSTVTLSDGGGSFTDSDTVADGSETVVTAGTNVTVTGSGTSGSPYVINSTSGGLSYETGPWTPTVTHSGGSYSTSTAQGIYTKIENRVTVSAYITGVSGTGTGTISVEGLPYPALSGSLRQHVGPIFFSGSSVNFYSIIGTINPGISEVSFYIQQALDGNNSTLLSDVTMSGGGAIHFNATYVTN